jgi:hypothetical protein
MRGMKSGSPGGHLLIERHGADAARLIDRMLDRGDRDGQLVWLRIKRAIEML